MPRGVYMRNTQYYWTKEEQHRLLDLHEKRGLSIKKVVEALGPHLSEGQIRYRIDRLQNDKPSKTYDWTKKHEDILVAGLKASKTSDMIAKELDVPPGLVRQRISILDETGKITVDAVHAPIHDHYWTHEEEAKLLDLRDTQKFGWTKLAKELGPVFTHTIVKWRHQRIKEGVKRRIWSWDKAQEDHLAACLEKKKAGSVIASEMGVDVCFINQRITMIQETEKKAAVQRRKSLYKYPPQWTAEHDEICIRLYLTGMMEADLRSIGLFGVTDSNWYVQRIMQHLSGFTEANFRGISPLGVALLQSYRDPRYRWTRKDVFELNFGQWYFPIYVSLPV
ncbi:hypothetical protein PMIN03_009019 [Paraphaeosphaeria minitans]